MATENIFNLLNENIVFNNSTIAEDLKSECIEKALQITEIFSFKMGDIIIKKGEKGDSIFLLLKGCVDIFDEKCENGKDIYLTSVNENEFFGEMGVIDETDRMATVKAGSKEVVVGKIKIKEFWDLFKTSPVVAENILRAINDRLKKVAKDFLFKIVKEKEDLKRFNLELEQQIKKKTEEITERDLILIKMDRINEIATLSSGIAHEINNPLSFVKSTLGFIRKSTEKMITTIKFIENKPLPEEIQADFKAHLENINFDYISNSFVKKIEIMAKGLDRIAVIVSNLKVFSRVDMGIIGLLDINKNIELSLDILMSEGKKDIKINTNFQTLPMVICNTRDINQCLFNILRNAIDFIYKTGVVSIVTLYDEKSEKVIINVVDDGVGIDDMVLGQIFNPFFTTKPVGSGTGIGLSLVEKIISDHSGNIKIESKKGEGTNVTVVIPVKGKDRRSNRNVGIKNK